MEIQTITITISLLDLIIASIAVGYKNYGFALFYFGLFLFGMLGLVA